MVNAIGDSLNVLRQNQTVSSSHTAPVAPVQQGPQPTRALPKHRLASYGRWASSTKEQHQVSASQVALQALQQASSSLSHIRQQLYRVIRSGSGEMSQQPLFQAEQERQRLSQIRPHYRGQLLLDHHFNLLSQTPAAPHAFVLRSVDLTVPKQRDERILVQLGQRSLHVTLAAGLDRQQLNKVLANALAPLGLNVELINGECLFKAPSSVWQQVQEGLLMMGEGQRLPAGELRNIHLEERFSLQDPREWGFKADSNLKQTLAKVTKTQQKIDAQIQGILATHAALLSQMQTSMATIPPQAELQLLAKFMQPQPFVYQLTSLMAQGNANRDQVTALLG